MVSDLGVIYCLLYPKEKKEVYYTQCDILKTYYKHIKIIYNVLLEVETYLLGFPVVQEDRGAAGWPKPTVTTHVHLECQES